MREHLQKTCEDSFAKVRDDASSERIQEALTKLSKLDQGIQESKARLARISQAIKEDSRLNAAAQEQIKHYLDEFNVEVWIQFEHLYELGAKDCVRLLRELGVLK